MQFDFVVSTNVAAVRLWDSLGFSVTARHSSAFRHPHLGLVDALVVRRTLDAPRAEREAFRLARSPAAFGLRSPTTRDPLRVLVSGCLVGLSCGVDGTDYGLGGVLGNLLALPTLKTFVFCPEEKAQGTPRGTPDIHGGDGEDVLDGTARIYDQFGADLTEKMLSGARAMLAYAEANAVELVILTDMSAACGSQVISDGCTRTPRRSSSSRSSCGDCLDCST